PPARREARPRGRAARGQAAGSGAGPALRGDPERTGRKAFTREHARIAAARLKARRRSRPRGSDPGREMPSRQRAPASLRSWRAGSRGAEHTVLAVAAARTPAAAAAIAAARAWPLVGASGTARPRAARTGRVGVVAGRGMVGGKAHRAARVSVRMRGLGARLAAARAALLARAGLARSTAVRVAVAGRAGVDAVGHVPGAEGCRIALRQRLGSLGLALLERLLRLFRGLFAAHGQPAMRLLAAAPATVLAHVVEAAQFAPFVGGVV